MVDAQPVSGRAMLGQTLRVLREKAGKSLGQLADETGYEKSYLSRLESGERLSKVTVMEDLDGYYGTGDLLLSHWKAARLDAFKDQY
ncbi:helix-turn-helix domain-containing protein, partial [Streptomyces sp.]|uniref:helix-turn-helix domain-containing protein n=1 Tax=Streptomyces sp. TaxID=1931 RepID=UPI0039C9EBA5